MIEPSQGDLFEADAEALVNTVNCVGFMGRGIAAQFKRAFPGNFAAYAAACKRGEVRPGRMLTVPTGELVGPRYVINFPTKRHWRGKSRMEDIEHGLVALVEEVRRLGLRSIAIPPLGCGLGGLDWEQVRPRIEQAFAALSHVRVLLYEPSGAPEAGAMVRSKQAPRMTPGRAMLLSLMHRYLGGLMDPFLTLLEVHKLMYFAQEAGEPLRLRYVKGPFGPYAENLRQVLAHVEGHFVSGYADGGDVPDKPLTPVPGAVKAAMAFLTTRSDVHQRFDRVAALVEGFETPFGMELLATVHWVASHEDAHTPEAAVKAVHMWNARKRQFSDRQIRVAWEVLAAKGWLAVPDTMAPPLP